MHCPVCSSKDLTSTISPNGGELYVAEEFNIDCIERYESDIIMYECMSCEIVFYLSQ